MRRLRHGGLRPVWPLAALVILLAGAAVAAVAGRSGGNDHGEQLALWGMRHSGEEAEREGRGGQEVESEAGSRRGGESFAKEAMKAAARVRGREGGEAERVSVRTPWGEQVANRAYPRSYVDDQRAKAVRRAFRRLPSNALRSAFRSSRDYTQAIAAAPDRWTLFGPVTPRVSGEASQFWDPVTKEGPETMESGRIAQIALDPACAPGDCRLWAATAGGGIWWTEDALANPPQWNEPPGDLPTNAFGSIFYDAGTDTVYAGSGEPNGSSDSEAGLGLLRSTDSGATWELVEGSEEVAINRSIGAIAVDPSDPDVIYIGTALARHGSSSVNGGRRTPPDAPTLGVYRSIDGGATFEHMEELSEKAPQSPEDPATGNDFFQGGINRLELDPNDSDTLYAAVLGYGLWRSEDNGETWEQVFHTMNQTDFGDPSDPSDDVGDFFGDITEFDLVDLGAATRAFLGDASDDWAVDGDPTTDAPHVYRHDDVAAIPGDPTGQADDNETTKGWVRLSSEVNGTNGFGAYYWCQNGQCSYDAFVVSPPGEPNEVWLGGAMNYDELPAYAGEPPRSNGRGVVRSTNADRTPTGVGGVDNPANDATSPTWQDMTAVLNSDEAWDVEAGLHPDQQSLGFSADGNQAFVASDGGLARVDVSQTEDRSGSCDQRMYSYAPPAVEPLTPADLKDCRMLLGAPGIPTAIVPLNDGLATLQFQSLSFNPRDPFNDVLGGTQDNGTWSFTGGAEWFESVGGDGGQSGFDPGINSGNRPAVRYHNYFSATPEVNFDGNNDEEWLNIRETLENSGENQSFYTPFIADPVTPGRAYTGLEHVWRTDNNGGDEARLKRDCRTFQENPNRTEMCGDWAPIGPNLTGGGFGGDRAGQFVVATERALGDTGTMWAATRTGRVFVSKNADAAPNQVQWRRIDRDANTPDRFVSGIAIDPANPNRAFVAYSGYDAYTPSTPGHVFEVTYDPTSRSSQWVDRSGNLGDQPITGIAHAGATGDTYASTDFGVVRLPAGSSEWEEAAPGMPQVAVYGLALSQCGQNGKGLLYAATHGRSAYALELPGFTGAACGTGGQPPAPPPSPPPAPPGTPPADPAAPDRLKPTLRVSRVKKVRRPRRSTLRGRATDASGIRRVRIRWGDRRSTTARLRSDGRFTARHRYRRAKRFRIRVTATDNAGNVQTRRVTARVLKRRTGNR